MLTTASEWTSLLASWLPAARAAQPDLPPSLSCAAATPADLTATEARLKLVTPLPPSYRAFLLATNGWQFASRAVPLLRPVQKITWFKKQNRDWIEAYTDPALRDLPVPPEETYYNYSPDVAEHFRSDHFPYTLQISEIGDAAVYLLNPMVVQSDGEWEAWFLANWLPGVCRYRSFAALMWNEYHRLIGQPLEPPPHIPVPLDDLPTVYRDPPTKTPRRAEARKARRTISELLRVAQDHSPRTTMRARVKAIKELAARRDPAVTGPLRALLKDPLPNVCAAAMIALGEIQAEEAVQDLITLIRNQDENYHCAIAALGRIGTPPARDFLVSCMKLRAIDAPAAAMALAPHADPRGVAILNQMMGDIQNKHHGEIAGSLLAGFGRAGLEPLVAAAHHPDPVIRRRAYKGLYELAYVRAKTPEGQRAAETLRTRHPTEPEPDATGLNVYLKVLPRHA